MGILKKGLKFIPTPRATDPEHFTTASARISTQMARANFFRHPVGNFSREPFTDRSTFTPPTQRLTPGARLGLSQVRKLTKPYEKPIPTPKEDLNLTNLEYKELALLTSPAFRTHTIIQSADKGSAIVAQSRHNYIAEAHRQLNNPKHYICLGPKSLLKANLELIHALIDELLALKVISPKQAAHLKGPDDPRPRLIYFLAKIHKLPWKWPTPFIIPPGRPIVSDVSSESYRISQYLDSFLQPLASSHPSYVKDSYDFANLVRSITLPPNSILVVADVDSMYTNIRHDMGLAAVKQCLLRNPDPTRPPLDIFLKLLEITLTRNDFYFNGNFYLQICGTAMGKVYAPSYANIFMAEWERRVLSNIPNAPLVYKRFLDDIFMVWTHGKEALNSFIDTLNADNPCIRLVAETSVEEVNFLDLTLFPSPSDPTRLLTKIYHKPTDTMELLHSSSFHPHHTFKGIVKSQIIRFHRLSSRHSDFLRSTEDLFAVLRDRGYPDRSLRRIFRRTHATLQNTSIAHPTDQTPSDPPPLPPRHPTRDSLSPTPPGANPCGHPNCRLCHHISPTKTFRSTTTGEILPIHHSLNCQSKHVIYLVTCSTCSVQYVGLTHNRLNHRFWNHRHAIRTLGDTALSRHMNEHPNPWDFTVTPITQLPPNPLSLGIRDLRLLETKMIRRLRTLAPHGLNSLQQIERPVLPFIVPYSKPAIVWANNMKAIWEAFFTQEFPTLLAHTPITAFSLGARSLQRLLTSANIRPTIEIDTPFGPQHWHNAQTPPHSHATAPQSNNSRPMTPSSAP